MEKLRTPDLAQTIRLELGSKFLVERPGSLAETCAQAEVYLTELMTAAVVHELSLEAVARGLTFKSIEPTRTSSRPSTGIGANSETSSSAGPRR
jgi:hypothetical protein